ncbi:hypothetical protein AX16_005961 [Volvariella volvacea WC 439]|nr:hypothetical protein AX16_005961 [Volvariella volvacea WC 439]
MGMLRRGGEIDLGRAAVFFVRWWREEGALVYAKSPLELVGGGGVGVGVGADAGVDVGAVGREGGQMTGEGEGASSTVQGWGFDFQWELTPGDLVRLRGASGNSQDATSASGAQVEKEELASAFVQEKMEACIDRYKEVIEMEDKEELNVSPTQRKKQAMIEEKEKRKMRYAARKGGK